MTIIELRAYAYVKNQVDNIKPGSEPIDHVFLKEVLANTERYVLEHK